MMDISYICMREKCEHGVWGGKGSSSRRRNVLYVVWMGSIPVFYLTDMSLPRREGEGRMHEDKFRPRTTGLS
jgi:hypothetical protein